MADFVDGRYVLADTDARGARDVIGLTSQVKFMREGFQTRGHDPALILIVVAEPERKAAVARILTALDGSADPAREVGTAPLNQPRPSAGPSKGAHE